MNGPRSRLARGQPRPCEPRSAEGDECDRALPHGGTRRPCRALRGAYTNIAYNSCRNRHCPKCQGAAAREWLAEREVDLLPVPYFHVVFTLPARIASIARQNKAVVYDLLFKASSEAVLTIAADPEHLGRPHRHHRRAPHLGSTMTHHPHVHMIVPGGGIALNGKRWLSCQPRFLLPVPVLTKLFQGLMLHKLLAAHKAGLSIFGQHAHLAERKAFAAYLAPLTRINYSITSSAVARSVEGISRAFDVRATLWRARAPF